MISGKQHSFLEKEVKHYLSKLDAEEHYSDITDEKWIFEVEE